MQLPLSRYATLAATPATSQHAFRFGYSVSPLAKRYRQLAPAPQSATAAQRRLKNKRDARLRRLGESALYKALAAAIPFGTGVPFNPARGGVLAAQSKAQIFAELQRLSHYVLPPDSGKEPHQEASKATTLECALLLLRLHRENGREHRDKQQGSPDATPHSAAPTRADRNTDARALWERTVSEFQHHLGTAAQICAKPADLPCNHQTLSDQETAPALRSPSPGILREATSETIREGMLEIISIFAERNGVLPDCPLNQDSLLEHYLQLDDSCQQQMIDILRDMYPAPSAAARCRARF